ncbi:MAG: restriction endonuclease subunit S [Clostridium sp.]|nr:MAG: restriction endonuclease subunit S [Clostridium sp.]
MPFSRSSIKRKNLIESGSKKCILYGELFTTYDEVINEIKSRTNVDGYISQGNEILFPSSTTVDAMSLIAPSALNEKKGFLLGGDMFVLELLPGFNNEYISYYLNLIAKRNLAKYAQGTTITHLYFEHIKKMFYCICRTFLFK